MSKKDFERMASEIPDGHVPIKVIRNVCGSDHEVKALFHEPWIHKAIFYAEENIN